MTSEVSLRHVSAVCGLLQGRHFKIRTAVKNLSVFLKTSCSH